MTNYKQLFLNLDQYIYKTTNKMSIELWRDTVKNKHLLIKKKPRPCCLNPDIRKKEFRNTCLNCGKVKIDDIEIFEEDNCFCSPPMKKQYNNRTLIKGIMRNSPINRIHIWTNNFYDENQLEKSFREIDKYRDKIEKCVLERAKYNYKVIYIDKKISSRCLVLRGVYMYCIYKAYIELKKDVDFHSLLEIIGKGLVNKNKKLIFFTLKNYNSAVLKMDYKLFYHKDLDKLYNKYKDKIGDYKKIDLILDFNKYKTTEIIKNKKSKTINSRSLLVGLIYKKMKDISKKEYAKDVKISILTLIKVLNKIN